MHFWRRVKAQPLETFTMDAYGGHEFFVAHWMRKRIEVDIAAMSEEEIQTMKRRGLWPTWTSHG